jgi:C4-dicarboxylate transporter
MKRLPLLLLIVLPLIAVVLNQEVVSAILIICWTSVVIPLCILQLLDFLRGHSTNKRSSFSRNLLRAPTAFLGLVSCIMGASIIAWCLYNVGVRRMPEYSVPNAVGLALGSFGIAPTLFAFGSYLIKLSVQR